MMMQQLKIASLSLLLWSTASSEVFPQDPQFHHMQVVSGETSIDDHTKKMLYVIIRDMDPDAVISMEADQLKFRTRVQVPKDEALLLINGAGPYEFAYISSTSDHLPWRNSAGNGPMQDAQYDRAKQEWIEQNPEHYQKISGEDHER